MRLPLLAALLCAAVGASAAVSMSKSWRLTRDDGTGTTSVTMTETPEGVDLLTWGKSRFEAVKLTKEEAASLGRALLEAAGETACPSQGAIFIPQSKLPERRVVISCAVDHGDKPCPGYP